MFARSLRYPLAVTAGALAVCLAFAVFADIDQLSALMVVMLGVLGYTGYRMAVALGRVRCGLGERQDAVVRRVRQEHRLVTRSWLEIESVGRKRWLPVYFTPALVGLTESAATVGDSIIEVGSLRLCPAGRARAAEPPGRIIDNPSRPAPDLPERTTTVARIPRRLLLDAQSAVVAPFAGLMWVYVADGGLPAFAGATSVAAATATWLAAVRGSDPS